MTVTTYAGLVDAISGWLNRQDLDARIPDFITLAEAKFNRTIKHEFGLSNLINFTLAGSSFPLPADFAGMLFLQSSDTSVPLLDFVSHAEFIRRSTNNWGTSDCYTILGQNLMVNGATTAPTFTLAYRTRLDAAVLGGNWLLETHPDVYLYGCLVAGEPYIVEDERLPMWKGLLEEAIAEVNLDSLNVQFSSQLQMTSNGYDG